MGMDRGVRAVTVTVDGTDPVVGLRRAMKETGGHGGGDGSGGSCHDDDDGQASRRFRWLLQPPPLSQI
uniref:Uncharacterized protein n=1 Tax=Oryza sativa subsp. indica TaxID=39946 RepID=C5NNY7_ORYSI|nr:hypothetical protein [Oryza sativa Indica Group]